MRPAISHIVLAASAVLVPTTLSATQAPCAVASQLADEARQNGSPGIDIDVAYACLRSVPVDTAGDIKLLKALKTIINFQSDLSYVAYAPPGWLWPAVDVPGVLDSILSKLQRGGYSCEYDLQLDVHDLITSVYDFHLTYYVDMLYDIFSWQRSGGLVSISKDGTALPEIYVGGDDFTALTSGNASYTPSSVSKINDTDVETWINQFAALEPWSQDPDANYNHVLYNIPRTSSLGDLGGTFTTGFLHFPGAVTKLSFANGTSTLIPSYATVNTNLSGVTNGNSLFRKLRSIETASASASSPASSAGASSVGSSSSVTTNNLYTSLPTSSSISALEFYPTPILISPDKKIAGYFPSRVTDLAVVALPTFDPVDNHLFQNKFRTFLATAKAKEKTRLIIDVRGNGGGHVNDGYSLFKELFPSQVPYGAANLAAWPLLNAIGEVASTLDDSFGVSGNGIIDQFLVDFDLTVRNTSYESWSDFYGPVHRNNGQYTNLRRYNFSAPQNNLLPPVYGYGNDTIPQPQTFEADNIVVLSDGFCGSTCALFLELMKTQAGVQSITVGGRKQYCPMQAVGASKGSADNMMYFLAQSAKVAYEHANATQKKLFAPYTSLQEGANVLFSRVDTFTTNVNFQNNIRKNDESVTPLMFVYEASNCRFFYTAEMIADQSLVWEHTYNLQWGNAACIPDSTGQPSAQTGFDTSYFQDAPPTCAKNLFGATVEWSYPLPSGPSNTTTPTSAAMASRRTSVGVWWIIGIICGLVF